MKREARIVSNGELRTTSEGRITGYAAVFNSLSDDLGGFAERIMPGAFKRTIKTADVRALINHDPNLVLGRTTSGTLTLEEDSKGLKFTCELPDTNYANDLRKVISRGDVSQCSFGFAMVKQRWLDDTASGGNRIRELLDVDLFDVSAVTYPAYQDTSVQLRDLRRAYESVSYYRSRPESPSEQVWRDYIDGDPIAARRVAAYERALKDFAGGVR